MKTYVNQGIEIVASPFKSEGKDRWTLKEKLLLGLTLRQYLAQAFRNPFNWVLAAIFAVGLPLIAIRFIYGLGAVTGGSNDYPWFPFPHRGSCLGPRWRSSAVMTSSPSRGSPS
jgi:hypothetical protein